VRRNIHFFGPPLFANSITLHIDISSPKSGNITAFWVKLLNCTNLQCCNAQKLQPNSGLKKKHWAKFDHQGKNRPPFLLSGRAAWVAKWTTFAASLHRLDCPASGRSPGGWGFRGKDVAAHEVLEVVGQSFDVERPHSWFGGAQQ
jgi:hypothetical protein